MKNNLQKCRWEKNMTLKQLSISTGVSVSELNKIENNDVKDIYYSTACKIAKALKLPVETVFPY